jgi:GT2 family glycosyltransferase
MPLPTDEPRADIDIIIVHYHAAAPVREAMRAIKLDSSVSNIRVRVIVADNGSTTEERALLDSLDVEYLDIGHNAGYAGAANIAFGRTSANCVILMNEDVIVLPGCLRALHAALMSGASVAGPEFFWDRDRTFRLPCTEERTRRSELLKVASRRSLTRLAHARQNWRHHARRHWQTTTPIVSIALSGALLAFRRDTWMAVGPFDDKFRLYFEENDWLMRVSRAGLESLYVPAAKAIHLHNPSTMRVPQRVEWEAESFALFGNRYYGERFMRRLFLLSRRESVVPDWHSLDASTTASMIISASKETEWPVWVELTPSPLGYPAAATCIVDRTVQRWSMPAMRGLDFLDAPFYLQFVDAFGTELGRYRLDRIVCERSRSTHTSAEGFGLLGEPSS